MMHSPRRPARSLPLGADCETTVWPEPGNSGNGGVAVVSDVLALGLDDLARLCVRLFVVALAVGLGFRLSGVR
jgi:hypothetical protein